MNDDIIIVPGESRTLAIAEEDFTIRVPAEWRKIRILETMLVASKQHTEGDSRRWTVQYDRWLDNTAQIETIDIQSNSLTLTVAPGEILGTDVTFVVSGGVVGEVATIALVMTDDRGNVKHDTIRFVVIPA
jgi:hypothetical protein